MFLKFQKCIKLSKWNILIEKCHVENEMLTDMHSRSLFLLLYTLETSNQAETVETRRVCPTQGSRNV